MQYYHLDGDEHPHLKEYEVPMSLVKQQKELLENARDEFSAMFPFADHPGMKEILDETKSLIGGITLSALMFREAMDSQPVEDTLINMYRQNLDSLVKEGQKILTPSRKKH